jgi:hypothetical protein
VFALLVSFQIQAQPPKPPVEDIGEVPEPKVSPEGKARLQAINPDFDFGAVRSTETQVITHKFQVKNAGEEILKIDKIKPSCGCTSAIASATQIAPGATASITAALNPKGKYGNQSITVRVLSNDPTNPGQVLRMTGTILANWRVIPVQLDMGAIGRLESVTKEVTVTSQYMKDDPVHKISAIKVDSPNIRAVTAETPQTSAEIHQKNYLEVRRTVRVSVTASEKEGEESHRILIITNDPKSATHTVTVRWSVEGDLSFTPNKVFVSDVKGRKVSRDLVISSRSGTAFEILTIEQEGSKGNQDLEVVAKPDATPTRKVYTITPKMESEAPTDTRSGKIIIKTNHPEQPVVSIPYTAILRK